MSLDVEAFLEHLRGLDRRERTLEGYRQELGVFARWFLRVNGREVEDLAVTPLDVREWKLCMDAAGLAPATINRRLAALRGYFKWAHQVGRVPAVPTDGIRDKRQQPQAPRSLPRQTVYALRRAADERVQLADSKANGRPTPSALEARRDRAILHLFLGAGLRLAELCDLDRRDIELHERSGRVVIRSGKGGKWREVPLNVDVRRALTDWLSIHDSATGDSTVSTPAIGASHLDTPPAQPLFTGRRGQRLAGRGVQRILSRIAAFAQLPPATITPHVLRHTFAKSLLDQGAALTTVQALLGHDTIATTARYTQATDQDLVAATDLLAWVDGD